MILASLLLASEGATAPETITTLASYGPLGAVAAILFLLFWWVLRTNQANQEKQQVILGDGLQRIADSIKEVSTTHKEEVAIIAREHREAITAFTSRNQQLTDQLLKREEHGR